MKHKEFFEGVEKINQALGTNCLAIEVKGNKEYVMPVNIYVTKDREGLTKLYRTLQKMIRMDYGFESKQRVLAQV